MNDKSFILFLDMAKREFEQMDFSPVLRSMVEAISEKSQESFRTESSPTGKKWPPWVFGTLQTLQQFPNHPTLRVTGRLQESMRIGGPENIAEISRDEATFGSAVNYAKIHNFGASFILGINLYGRRGGVARAGSTINIPERTFLDVTEEMMVAFENELADYVEAQLMARFDAMVGVGP